jgi:hypothetical protein
MIVSERVSACRKVKMILRRTRRLTAHPLIACGGSGIGREAALWDGLSHRDDLDWGSSRTNACAACACRF